MPDYSNGIVVYGASWCPDCMRAKRFFSEHRVAHTWVNIDEDPEAMVRVRQINGGRRIIPTIIFLDGEVLVEPSNAELAEELGLYTSA
jgi:glutaredoxin